MTARSIRFVAVLAFALILAVAGAGRADDVNVTITPSQTPPPVVVQPSQAPSVTIQPSQPGVVVQPGAPPSVVVQPQQPPPTTVVVPGSPTVIVPSMPQILKADEIKARSVSADHIYVRDLDRD